MLRVASNALIVPPFECAWLSLHDYQLNGSCCLQFECKGENDVTVILKPFPGAKRWQHLQRQQAPAGGEQLAVEANYTVILGSHRNSKLKIEKNGDEKAAATGLPGCIINPDSFTAFWINYSSGSIAIGTGPVGSSLSYLWHDPEPPIADIQHIGLSCWDKHVSYRDVQLLPALAPADLLELQGQLQLQQHEQQGIQQQPVQHQQQQQQGKTAAFLLRGSAFDPTRSECEQQHEQVPGRVAPLLQLVQTAIITQLQPGDVCHMLQLSEALMPRTRALNEAAVQLAGEWLEQLVQHHLQELAMLPVDVLIDVLHEPLLDVSELSVFHAVAAWCQAGTPLPPASNGAASTGPGTQQQGQQVPRPELQLGQSCIPVPGSTLAQPQPLYVNAQPVQQPGEPCTRQGTCSIRQQRAMEQLLGQEQAQEQGQQQQVCCRSPSEVLDVLQLVRFALMSEPERQAVLGHPFTQACPLVQQCMQQDLQQLQEYHSRRPSPTGQAGFCCQQRRLVLPPRAALHSSLSSDAGGVEPVHATASIQPGSPQGFRAGRCNSAPVYPCSSTTSSSCVAQTAPDGTLQQPTTTSSSMTTGELPSGWLARGGSSGTGALNGWRSYRRRLAPSCKELMYVCDGDRNGVIHYIATEYGSKPWVNPVLSKAVDIKASSPPSRYTDPKAIVSGQFLNTSFAGPRYVRVPACQSQPTTEVLPGISGSGSSRNGAGHKHSIPSTWWQVDLGPQHRLLCNYYVIRHDGSQEGFARSWALQGSNDLQHWFDLRRHVDDSTLRLAGQYGSWPVTGPAACMPFRAFRLVLLGPTQSQTNPWAFCLSYWELYGYFYKLRNAGSNTAAMAPQAQAETKQPAAAC